MPFHTFLGRLLVVLSFLLVALPLFHTGEV
jgi:hypothetical protein